jgi:hypothetical protein
MRLRVVRERRMRMRLKVGRHLEATREALRLDRVQMEGEAVRHREPPHCKGRG